MSSAVQPHYFTTRDYHKMGEAGILDTADKTQLIQGEVVTMSPIGPEHADIIDTLCAKIYQGKDEHTKVRVQNPILLKDYSEPEPDIVLVKEKRYVQSHPIPEDVLLLIEVSKATLSYDRNTKIPLYAQFHIPECWIINLIDKQIEIYTQPAHNQYQETLIVRGNQVISPTRVPSIKLAINELFITT